MSMNIFKCSKTADNFAKNLASGVVFCRGGGQNLQLGHSYKENCTLRVVIFHEEGNRKRFQFRLYKEGRFNAAVAKLLWPLVSLGVEFLQK